MRSWVDCSLWWMWLGCCVVMATASQLYLKRVRRHHEVAQRNTSSDEDTSISTQDWFTQPLNHTNRNDSRHWEQRYWVNIDHYKRGAPVFLYVAGEWEEIGFSEELDEPWEENAKLHNALMFKLEHRFYGESQPTGGNLTLEDLEYLTTDQALADIANFINGMGKKYNMPKGTKWVAFGCSYSATLVAWLRFKYPHLVNAAVASSAPLLAKVNFPEYYNAVAEGLMKFYGNVTHDKTMGLKCLDTFKQANKEVHALIMTSEGLNSTIEKFRLNDTLEIDVVGDQERLSAYVFNLLFSEASTAVQDNSYNETSETWGIERFCDTLLNESLGDVVDRYAEIHKIIHSEEDIKENEFNRQWSYQSCAEFGFFQTADNENSILGNYVQEEYYFQACKEEFGDRFTEQFVRQKVDSTNNRYGGLELNATRVIYVHGSLDPWITLGLNRTKNPFSPVIVIEGGSHCGDSRPESEYDSAALRTARANISHILREWLGPST